MSQEESAARQERLLAEQACANAIFRKQWHEAIMLALQLEQVRVCASALFCVNLVPIFTFTNRGGLPQNMVCECALN